MMQRIQREMLRLEKLPMLIVPWLGSSVGQRELGICTSSALRDSVGQQLRVIWCGRRGLPKQA